MKVCKTLAALFACIYTEGARGGPPVSKDPRLVVELFSAAPEIVTPIGIAADPSGKIPNRVYVIESHTHFPQPKYAGPKTDRIRFLEDVNRNGKADRIGTLLEGLTHTMGIGFHPNGMLYVATRKDVYRFSVVETDRGPTAGPLERLMHLETTADYPHNGLSGFAFNAAGDFYFGLGENFGAPYKLIGRDGAVLTGGGEGGNVYRCKGDGSGLIRWATGFWNPFHSCLDAFDRLFVVDNDPDDRPPCRLLHVVQGGDFGYRFRNGRKGTHPFTAWNGELPGTLPMTSGTGEAPSGVLCYDGGNLPVDYRGTLLATSWGDHRIDRFRLEPRGASFHAQPEPVVVGDENFRPVGVVQARDGSLLVTDWVDKSYSVHGRGRVWRIRNKDSSLALTAVPRYTAEAEPRAMIAAADPEHRARLFARIAASGQPLTDAEWHRCLHGERSADVRSTLIRLAPKPLAEFESIAKTDPSAEVRAEALRRLSTPTAVPTLLTALESNDPFIAQAALVGLRQSLSFADVQKLAGDAEASHRLTATLLLRERNAAAIQPVLSNLLHDADARVRFAAVQAVAEMHLTAYRSKLVEGLQSGDLPGRLLEAYLAALDDLDRKKKDAGDETSGETHLVRLLADPRTSLALVRRALPLVRPDDPKLNSSLLDRFLHSSDVGVQLEAVRTYRGRGDGAERLAKIARESSNVELRAEAVVGLAADAPAHRALLLDLAAGGAADVRREALRSLRGATLSQPETERLQTSRNGDQASEELLERLLHSGSRPPRPAAKATAEWVNLLAGPADPKAGGRIYFHPKGPGCFKCHSLNGRGGGIGPDLTATGKTMTRQRLIESILEPSKEIAPQYLPWTLVRTDGRVLTGLFLGGTNENTQIYADAKGERFAIQPNEIESRKPSAVSIMPIELEAAMTLQEFRDLLAYLASAGKE